MRHMIPYKECDTYSVAILVKNNALNKQLINKHIGDGINAKDSIIFSLIDNENGKTPVSFIKEYLSTLLPALEQVGAKYLFVADSAYYKALTGLKKVSSAYGYVHPCVIKDYEHMNVVLGVNPKALYYDPSLKEKIAQGIAALNAHMEGTYKELGKNIIHSAYYPNTIDEVRQTLKDLHEYPMLVCDVEAYSLKHIKAGLGTIAFAWDKHNGVAFSVQRGLEGLASCSQKIIGLIKEFFLKYKGTIIYHNASYDIKILIYILFMKKEGDTKGLLKGLEVMTRSIGDTKIIKYLATNTTAGNVLGLKPTSQEFTGDYGIDVADITKIPVDDLLEYNLKDCLATWFVYDKYYPIMVADDQEELYREIMMPTVKVCLQMELNGMPMDAWKVGEADEYLSSIRDKSLSVVMNHPEIIKFEQKLRKREMVKCNLLLKKKQHPLSHFDYIKFNPNSNPQLATFLYEELGFEVTHFTDAGKPSTGNKVIKELSTKTTNKDHKILLDELVEYAKVNKLLTAFIPAFHNASVRGNGRSYLYGNFQIGGTVSGRLSCKEPNLQQIPSGTDYAKPIKKCFSAPNGWIMVGADMDSMEDKVAALITRDSMKLRVYTDGYDGHCLRAFYYFGDQMPDIEDTVESINSIKKKYPDLRQLSKAPTFLLTYAGTWIGLMGLGFTEEEAKSIEANYHRMYIESDEWVAQRIEQATKDGYVDVAFGLKVRTPILKQSILNTRITPYQAKAEARTAGNALGQSYGMLNTRAAIEFQRRLLASPYSLDVLPIAMIHDAIYLIVRDDVDVVAWVNKNLIECMSWDDLPELKHPSIKMSAALDLFHPSWNEALTLPNDASENTIFELADAFI